MSTVGNVGERVHVEQKMGTDQYFKFSYIFPNELILHFFSYLNSKDLYRVMSVDKECKVIANNEQLWSQLVRRTFGFDFKMNGVDFKKWSKKYEPDQDHLIFAKLAWETEEQNILEDFNKLSDRKRTEIHNLVHSVTENQKAPVNFQDHIQWYARGHVSGLKDCAKLLLQRGKIEI